MKDKEQKFLEFRDEYEELDDSIHFIKTAIAQYSDWYGEDNPAYRNLKYGLQQVGEHEKKLFEEYINKKQNGNLKEIIKKRIKCCGKYCYTHEEVTYDSGKESAYRDILKIMEG